ncbi:hypothetical protein PJP13_29690, partial [Mycobacterium kansasii]
MNKEVDEVWDYLDRLAENAQSWDHYPKINTTSRPSQSKEKGGVYLLKEDDDINAKVANLTRKLEAIELKKDKVNEIVCGICDCNI